MCYIIFTLFLLCSITLSILLEKPYTYKTKCPRCNGESTVYVTGSADQFETTKCDCGYEKEEVI